MKATLIYKRNRTFLTNLGRSIVVKMDLFEIHGEQKAKFPGGYKFSSTAFDSANSDERILFDSHPPKGPHFHVDSDKEGVPFEWVSFDASENLFIEMVTKKFGDL